MLRLKTITAVLLASCLGATLLLGQQAGKPDRRRPPAEQAPAGMHAQGEQAKGARYEGPSKEQLANAVGCFFQAKCAKCHDGGVNRGDLANILTPGEVLKDHGKHEQVVYPENLEKSELYQRVAVAGDMPPDAEPRATPAEIQALKDWILAGSPLWQPDLRDNRDKYCAGPVMMENKPIVTPEGLINFVMADRLAPPTFPQRTQPNYKYFSFAHLRNTENEKYLNTYIAGLIYVLNLTSSGNEAVALNDGDGYVPLEQRDADGHIFRIDINRLGWTEQMFQNIKKSRPNDDYLSGDNFTRREAASGGGRLTYPSTIQQMRDGQGRPVNDARGRPKFNVTFAPPVSLAIQSTMPGDLVETVISQGAMNRELLRIPATRQEFLDRLAGIGPRSAAARAAQTGGSNAEQELPQAVVAAAAGQPYPKPHLLVGWPFSSAEAVNRGGHVFTYISPDGMQGLVVRTFNFNADANQNVGVNDITANPFNFAGHQASDMLVQGVGKRLKSGRILKLPLMVTYQADGKLDEADNAQTPLKCLTCHHMEDSFYFKPDQMRDLLDQRAKDGLLTQQDLRAAHLMYVGDKGRNEDLNDGVLKPGDGWNKVAKIFKDGYSPIRELLPDTTNDLTIQGPYTFVPRGNGVAPTMLHHGGNPLNTTVDRFENGVYTLAMVAAQVGTTPEALRAAIRQNSLLNPQGNFAKNANVLLTEGRGVPRSKLRVILPRLMELF